MLYLRISHPGQHWKACLTCMLRPKCQLLALNQSIPGDCTKYINIHTYTPLWPMLVSYNGHFDQTWPTWKPATGFQLTLVECSAKWSGLQPTNKDNSSERGAKWVTKLPSPKWPGFVSHHFSRLFIVMPFFCPLEDPNLGRCSNHLQIGRKFGLLFRTNLALSNKSNPVTGRTRALDRILPSQLVSLSCDSMKISPLFFERQVWDGFWPSAGTCSNILLT